MTHYLKTAMENLVLVAENDSGYGTAEEVIRVMKRSPNGFLLLKMANPLATGKNKALYSRSQDN